MACKESLLWLAYRQRRQTRLVSRQFTVRSLRNLVNTARGRTSIVKRLEKLKSNGKIDPETNQAEPIELGWPPNEPGLCTRCRAMTGTTESLEALLRPAGFEHLNWYDLQYTARLGCDFCSFLWSLSACMQWHSTDDKYVTRETIRIFADVVPREPSDVHFDLEIHPLRNYRLQRLRVKIPSKDEDAEQILFPVTHDSDPASDFIEGRMIPESKELSPKVVNRIKEWLISCLDEHPSCPRCPPPKLPRRVLDVGSTDTPVSLYQPPHGSKAHYATLSYCWGAGANQVVTTTSNLQEHMQALPVSLPKTIIDAIEVCRRIDMRYLWIDSLCIVQDDEDDKLEQIDKMGLIYKRSTVTLVAASAKSSMEGFLGQSKFKRPSLQLPFLVDGSPSGTMYLQYNAQTSSNEEPIFHRAWTLQELLLSPRVLYFNSYQIMLKCLKYHYEPVLETHVASSLHLFMLPASIFSAKNDLQTEGNHQNDEKFPSREQHEVWRRIIEDYSKRDLTYFEDRLPALAGVASRLSKVWSDVYLAGLWRRSIIQGLGWHRRDRTELELSNGKGFVEFRGADHTKRIGMPSWSWATCPFAVNFIISDLPFVADAALISHEVVPISNKSPHGGVKEAYLTLNARVLKLSNLDLPVEVSGSSEWSYDDRVYFDYDVPKPNLDHCGLLFLGNEPLRGYFIVIERLSTGDYHRVGYSRLRKDTAKLYLTPVRETVTIW